MWEESNLIGEVSEWRESGLNEKPSNTRLPKRGDRKSYGNMLPKQGVYFLPDTKVLDFMRVLNDYKWQCELEGKYVEAKWAKWKYEELKIKEA